MHRGTPSAAPAFALDSGGLRCSVITSRAASLSAGKPLLRHAGPYALWLRVRQHHDEGHTHVERGLGPEGLGAEHQARRHHEFGRELTLGQKDLAELAPNRVGRRVLVVAPEFGGTMTQNHQRMARQSGLGGSRTLLRAGSAQRVGLADVLRWRITAPALLLERGLDRQAVDQIVVRIAAVALDPSERDVTAGANQFDERLPQITVGDRLLLAVEPTAFHPAFPPAVAKAVDDIRRVADHLERTIDGTHRLERGRDLHALIRRVGFRTAREGTAGHRPGPATRARVPAARAVGVGDGAGVSGSHDPWIVARPPVWLRVPASWSGRQTRHRPPQEGRA